MTSFEEMFTLPYAPRALRHDAIISPLRLFRRDYADYHLLRHFHIYSLMLYYLDAAELMPSRRHFRRH